MYQWHTSGGFFCVPCTSTVCLLWYVWKLYVVVVLKSYFVTILLIFYLLCPLSLALMMSHPCYLRNQPFVGTGDQRCIESEEKNPYEIRLRPWLWRWVHNPMGYMLSMTAVADWLRSLLWDSLGSSLLAKSASMIYSRGWEFLAICCIQLVSMWTSHSKSSTVEPVTQGDYIDAKITVISDETPQSFG